MSSFLKKSASLVLATLIISGCAILGIGVFKGVETSIPDVGISSVSFDGVAISAPLHIGNQSGKEAAISQITSELTIAGRQVSTKEIESPGDLADGATSELSVAYNLDYDHLLSVLGGFSDRESLPLVINTTVYLIDVAKPANPPVARKSEVRLDIPVLGKPRIIIDTLMLRSFNLAIAELELRVRVVNPGPIPLELDGLRYNLVVNGVTWHSQEVQRRVVVPVRSDVLLSAPFSMRPREHGTEVYRMLNMAQEFEFSVTGRANASAEVARFSGPYRWEFSQNGVQQFERL